MTTLKRLTILSFLSSLVLAGCWDSIEVERRGFVAGIAIDLANQQSQQVEQEQESDETKKFQLTQQIVVPSGLSMMQNSGSNRPAYRNLSQTGNTVIEMNRDMLKKVGRITNVTHLNILLFSEDVVKKEYFFDQLMDIFVREKEMLRGVKVAITKNKASDFLEILPETEKIPSQYISKLLDNKLNLEIAQPISVGDIQGLLLSKKSFVIPLLNIVNPTTIHYEGLSIFHGANNKVVGTLKGNEAKGLNILTNKNQAGTLSVKMNDKKVTFEILKLNNDIALKNKDKDNLKFDITINVTAGIAEQYGSIDVMSEKKYDELKKSLEKEIKQITKQTIEILQNDVNADVLGLNNHLYQFHYPLWDTIKDDWDTGKNLFSKSNAKIDVNVTIERPGNIIKSN